MDVQNLSAFIQVSEMGSFSRAAEKLFITQPAVSKRITALENQLGTKLFDRLGKSVRLTEAGTALIPSAKRILNELEESRRVISNLSGKVSGALRIGTSHHIGLHRLPPVLRSFTAEHPEVDLDIRFMDSEEACFGVLKGELELAIATLPSSPTANLTTKLIWNDPLDIVISNNHPLGNKLRVDLSKLLQYPAILPSQSTFTRSLLDQSLDLQKHSLKIAMETNYLETIKMMVSVGLGWSVLPVSMLSEDIKVLHIDGIDIDRTLGVAFHQQRTLSNAAKAFLDMLYQVKDGA